MPGNQRSTPFHGVSAVGVSLPINFFLKNFFLPNFARMADFAVWGCIFGSFQQNRINLYIKSYENRRFFGVFRRYGCIFYVFFCSISYWFTVFFVNFVVLICIYTKLRMQFWCLYVCMCVMYVLCMYMYCNRVCIVYVYVCIVYIYYF